MIIPGDNRTDGINGERENDGRFTESLFVNIMGHLLTMTSAIITEGNNSLISATKAINNKLKTLKNGLLWYSLCFNFNTGQIFLRRRRLLEQTSRLI